MLCCRTLFGGGVYHEKRVGKIFDVEKLLAFFDKFRALFAVEIESVVRIVKAVGVEVAKLYVICLFAVALKYIDAQIADTLGVSFVASDQISVEHSQKGFFVLGKRG